MAKIKKLSGPIVNQIAAGEVVIQPCSVLKELVENSLDAGATQIDIEFSGSGADMIKIKDNGMGMDKEDLLLSIQAHATSKIASAEDLYRVISCGFRGEALASIAEVSQFEITSSTKDSKTAHRLFKNGENYQTEIASRGTHGTTVSMKNLFHNVPVRRRFLKSERSESAYNLDILKKLSISRPWVGFKVQRDQKISFELPEDQSLENRIKDLGLFESSANLLKIDFKGETIKAQGAVVAPPIHFGNAQKVWLYINRRPIKDKALVQALVRSFNSYIPERRFPGAVVFIDIDPEEVDVNIHPTKSEVRFKDAEQVFKDLYQAIKQVLVGSSQKEDQSETQTIVYKSSGLPKTVPMNRSYGHIDKTQAPPFQTTSTREEQQIWNPKQNNKSTTPQTLFSEETNFEPDDVPVSKAPEKPVRSFSVDRLPRSFQVLKRFIVIEFDDHFAVMDQHAIHERILFNQLSYEDEKRDFSTQMLLSPINLPLPEGLHDLSDQLISEFDRMGFKLQFNTSAQNIEVQGIPDFYSAEKGTQVLEDILSELSEGILPQKEDLRRKILHSASCRSAIKAGDALTQEEIDRIVAATLSMDIHQGCCPHGRNAIWRISIDEANSMFNRP